MDNFEQKNPLQEVTIGSIANALTGKFSASVVKGAISKMNAQRQSQKFMSGESSYIFSEKMNQGSFGMSGAYGVSGVSLLKSSLAAYVGRSSAASSKSVTVNYNAISVGGVEYIDFEELTASQFIDSLNLACQQSILSVLEAYNAVKDELSKSRLDLLTALRNNDPGSDLLKKLISAWVKASNKFTNDFGDGLVVGVIWGAFGCVNMEMTSGSTSESWKYGGQADFSYANVFASVAVKATYDGNQSADKANVKVGCTSYVYGSVLDLQFKEWFEQVVDKSFSELADVKVLDKAPAMEISQGAPAIPEFVSPEPGNDIVEKVEEIKDLEGLDDMAKASAFEKTKINNPGLKLDEFLNNAGKPANMENLDAFNKKIFNNQIDTLNFPEEKPKEETGKTKMKLFAAQALSGEPAANESNDADYVPLGAWISNWPDLFPWLAQAYYNSIDNIEGEDAVKARVMLQDYQTLSRMYCIAFSSGITWFKRKDASKPKVPALELADTFANAAGQVQGFLSDSGKTSLKKIYDTLGEAAKSIYTRWNEIAFLRNCELGLGLLKDSKTIGDPLPGTDNTRQAYKLDDCAFDGKNFTAFSRAYKVLPLLTPDGDIWAFGPERGGLTSVYDTEIVFSNPGRTKYLVFKYNKEEETLSNADHNIKLYPIPFSAAQNVSGWKGMSFSTNIGSVNSLQTRLISLADQLSKLSAWSFNNPSWDRDWKGTNAYHQKAIKKQYVGVIDEIGNVFG